MCGKAKEELQSDKAAQTIDLSHAVVTNAASDDVHLSMSNTIFSVFSYMFINHKTFLLNALMST